MKLKTRPLNLMTTVTFSVLSLWFEHTCSMLFWPFGICSLNFTYLLIASGSFVTNFMLPFLVGVEGSQMGGAHVNDARRDF